LNQDLREAHTLRKARFMTSLINALNHELNCDSMKSIVTTGHPAVTSTKFNAFSLTARCHGWILRKHLMMGAERIPSNRCES